MLLSCRPEASFVCVPGSQRHSGMSEPAAAGAGTLSLNEVEAGQLNQLLQQAGFAMPPDGALQANGAAGEEVEGTGDTDSDDEDSQGGAAAAAANKGANVNYKSKPRRKATQKPVVGARHGQALCKPVLLAPPQTCHFCSGPV